MDKLEELLDDLVHQTKEAAGERAKGNGSYSEEREMDKIRMAITAHVTSLVEASKKEGES